MLWKKERPEITYDGQHPIAVSPSFSMLQIILLAFAAVVAAAEFVTPLMRSTLHVGRYPEGQACPGEYIYIGRYEDQFPVS